LTRNRTAQVSRTSAVLALAAVTGCSPGGSSPPRTATAGVTASGRSAGSGSAAGASPSWAKSLGSGVIVTSPGASAAGSPGAVLTSAIAAIEAGSYAKICYYLQPSQQSKCSAELGSAQASAIATAMPTVKNLTVSYTATDGTMALVGMTGTICSPDQKPSCVTNNDPAAIFDNGKTFRELWTETVASTSEAYSLTPMIKLGGKWYGYSAGFLSSRPNTVALRYPRSSAPF
jgi:hypothetical protein